MSQHTLDTEQTAAATIDATQRQVVLAGPGAGKTQVVAALVEHLVLEEQIDPVHGLLVLSFSNAAVHAVDDRLRARGIPPVAVRTIDSLAARIVRLAAEDDLAAMSFDARIARATQLLEGQEWDDRDDLEHVVVDEAQDVVGVRADFVWALLHTLPADAGFTLLGDPAQAIYDFQLQDRDGREPLSRTTSRTLLEQAKAMGAVTVALQGQYRAATRDARAATALRSASGEPGQPSDIEDFWNEVVHIGDMDAVVRHLQRSTGTVALLTRTNGQAMLVARELRMRGVELGVRRSAQSRALAGWIGRALGEVSVMSMSREELRERLAETCPDLDEARAWRALRAVSGSRGAELDIASLIARIESPAVATPDLMDEPATRVVVSTIHRAKGLEFDDVVLMESRGQSLGPDSSDERSREQFVALTRARRTLMRADAPSDRYLYRVTPRGSSEPRWIVGGHQKWHTHEFEIRAEDLEPWSIEDSRARSVLMHPETVGREVALEPDRRSSTLSVPVYSLRLDEVDLARTTRQFGTDFAARIGSLEKKRRGWPTLVGGRIESVATAVAAMSSGTREQKLSLIPVVAGLLKIDWK